jgi:hypothetical protein
VYHSKTYLPYTLKKLFGEKIQILQDITHGQTHRKNQDPELGFLSVLTKNTCAGQKFAGYNQQEAKDIGKPLES